MAKITRVFHRIFGSAAGGTDIGKFGSFAGGAPVYSSDPGTITSLSGWLTGWAAAVVGGTGGTSDPFLEDENAVDFVHSRQIGYLLQQGIAEYDPDTPYYTGSWCTYGGVPYVSTAGANAGNLPPTSPGLWTPYDSTRTGTLVAFAGINLPAGYLACDGSAVLRASYPALFSALSVAATGNTVNGSPIVSGLSTTVGMVANSSYLAGPGIPLGAFITSIDSPTQVHINVNATATAAGVALVAGPWGLGNGTTTFNLPDMRGRTAIGAGTGAGLSARVMTQALGEESHRLTVGELPSHTHSGTTGTENQNHDHAVVDARGRYGQIGISQANDGTTSLPGVREVTDAGVTGFGDLLQTSVELQAHNHTYTTDGGTGGGGTHNVMQPSLVCQYIIKY